MFISIMFQCVWPMLIWTINSYIWKDVNTYMDIKFVLIQCHTSEFGSSVPVISTEQIQYTCHPKQRILQHQWFAVCIIWFSFRPLCSHVYIPWQSMSHHVICLFNMIWRITHFDYVHGRAGPEVGVLGYTIA